MDLRPDLSNPKWVISPYLTNLVAPVQPAGTMDGVLLASTYTTAGSAQTNRADGTEAAVTQVTFDDYAYSCTEEINHQVCDERYLGYCGGKEKAQLMIAKSAVTNVHKAVEALVATGILDSANITSADATPSGTTLALQIDAAVQALRQTAGVNKIGIVCSEYVYNALLLPNASVQARLAAPANVVFNTQMGGPNFRDAKMMVLAGEFMLDNVLVGGNASWHTAVTNKNYLCVMALPDPSQDIMTETRLGVTVQFAYPDFGLLPVVGTYYSDPRHAEVVDAWARVDYVELNPEFARLIKLA